MGQASEKAAYRTCNEEGGYVYEAGADVTFGLAILGFIVVLDVSVAMYLWWSDPNRRVEELERRLRRGGGA